MTVPVVWENLSADEQAAVWPTLSKSDQKALWRRHGRRLVLEADLAEIEANMVQMRAANAEILDRLERLTQ